MGAFVGMGMAGNVTGGSMQNLYQMAQNQPGGGQPPQGGMGAQQSGQPPQGSMTDGWTLQLRNRKSRKLLRQLWIAATAAGLDLQLRNRQQRKLLQQLRQ